MIADSGLDGEAVGWEQDAVHTIRYVSVVVLEHDAYRAGCNKLALIVGMSFDNFQPWSDFGYHMAH